MTALASSNNAPVNCPVCGQTVERKSRRQLYCSTRCRTQASRSQPGEPSGGSSGGDHLNAPATIFRYEPRQKPNDFKGAKIVKTGWSDGIVGPRRVISVEVIAGRDWQEVVSAGGVKSYVSHLGKRALVDRDGA